MSLKYNPSFCENCQKEQSGAPSGVQNWIFSTLMVLGFIPGVIYWKFANPKCCHICGLKKKDRKNK